MLKRFIALAIASTALGLAATFYARVPAVRTGGEVDGSLFTLSGRAAAAAAQGELFVDLTMSGDSDSVASLDDAFTRYTVSVGEPVLTRSYVIDDIGIATWYKVRVSETLSQKPLFQCSNCGALSMPDPPSDLLPSLFLNYDSSKKVATPAIGPTGVFAVNLYRSAYILPDRRRRPGYQQRGYERNVRAFRQ